jgi:hypothetical protein
VKLAVAGLAALNVALGAALAWKALERKPVVVVPWAKAEEELLPGRVPDGAAREFALRYVLLFDNYTPGTIDRSTELLKGLIAPRFWTEAAEALEKRRGIVHEGRMSVQVAADRLPVEIERFEDGTLEVRFDALRRTYIADRLSTEARARYVVALEPAAPTAANPWGLLVIGQSIHENR